MSLYNVTWKHRSPLLTKHSVTQSPRRTGWLKKLIVGWALTEFKTLSRKVCWSYCRIGWQIFYRSNIQTNTSLLWKLIFRSPEFWLSLEVDHNILNRFVKNNILITWSMSSQVRTPNMHGTPAIILKGNNILVFTCIYTNLDVSPCSTTKSEKDMLVQEAK